MGYLSTNLNQGCFSSSFHFGSSFPPTPAPFLPVAFSPCLAATSTLWSMKKEKGWERDGSRKWRRQHYAVSLVLSSVYQSCCFQATLPRMDDKMERWCDRLFLLHLSFVLPVQSSHRKLEEGSTGYHVGEITEESREASMAPLSHQCGTFCPLVCLCSYKQVCISLIAASVCPVDVHHERN